MFANATIVNIIPIRTLSALTGVRSVTLRAWERRYGLLKPVRTHKGHRLYSQQDVELVKKILIYLEQGIAISQVKLLLRQEIPLQKPQTIAWLEYQSKILTAVKHYNIDAINENYNELISLYPIDVITHQLIIPLLSQLEASRKKSDYSSTQRSFFLFYLRNKLATALQNQGRLVDGPRILVTCLQESKTEIDMLLFALAAIEQQYQVILLGVDVSLLELAETINDINVAGLVVIHKKISKKLLKNLSLITKDINVPIFMEGKVNMDIYNELIDLGIFTLPKNRKLAWKQIAKKINS